MKEKQYGFEHLRIYQLSEQLADCLYAVVRAWDRFDQDTVGKQMVRAADRIGADIAEGSGRGTPKDNRRFIDDARGSLYETRHWLRRAYCRKLLAEEHVNKIHDLIDELGPKLNAYRSSLRRRSQE